MKHAFLMAAFSLFFQSQAMHRDPRVGPQLRQLGFHDEHFGCSTPNILPDGKKVYYLKGKVHDIERIVRVRYLSNDTLDTSFGQNGIEIGEIVGSSVPILIAINNSVQDFTN